MNNLIAQIHSFNPCDKVAVILRHGDRDSIPQNTFGNDVMLNPKGINNSLLFGSQLKDVVINAIYTSPLLRCEQTAKLISQGAEKQMLIKKSNELGNPGLHVTNAEIAGKTYLRYGLEELYARFVKSESLPGFANQTNLLQAMTEFLESQTKKEGVTMFVSHDLVIAMYQYCLDKKIYNPPFDWINYLDGICVKL